MTDVRIGYLSSVGYGSIFSAHFVLDIDVSNGQGFSWVSRTHLPTLMACEPLANKSDGTYYKFSAGQSFGELINYSRYLVHETLSAMKEFPKPFSKELAHGVVPLSMERSWAVGLCHCSPGSRPL